MCIPGFENTDRNSYNGCEGVNSTAGAAGYRFQIAGVGDIPGTYGGYRIGDYEVEYYMAWLYTAGSALPIQMPMNNVIFNTQWSALYAVASWPIANPNPTATANLRPILWY